MLKKRLIGVVTVRRGWAVQSFGYRRWLPLGKPEILAQNLDRWGVDEILVQVIDRVGVGPDFDLLMRLGKMGLATPLIFGGGISSLSDADRIINQAADRVCVDSLLHDNPSEVERIAHHLGAQALIGAIPVSTLDGIVIRYDHRDQSESPLPRHVLESFANGVVSEAMIIDWRHEGFRNGFDEALVDVFPVANVPLIMFGGLSEPAQLRRVLVSPRVTAVAIGNFLAYQEHAVQRYREALAGIALRPPEYCSTRVL